MKADSPRPPLVKYGMTAEYADSIVDRHFTVTCEGRAYYAMNYARVLDKLPAVQAVLNQRSAPAVTAEPVPVSSEPAPPAPPPQDLRAAFGLI